MHKKFLTLLLVFPFFSFPGFMMPGNPDSDWVSTTLENMTLREKISQMIISYSNGLALEDGSDEFVRLKKLIEEDKIGGIIFFRGNTIEQAALINRLQSLSDLPLLISADFERGTAMRLEDGSQFPNNMGVGATGDTNLAYQMGYAIGLECRALGVHQNYAPVMDVNNNILNPIINVRSFGQDPNLVSKMGIAMIRGLQDAKTIATAKHFPGHGDTDIDSHSDLPVISFGRDRLDTIELVPFVEAINNGVMSIMTAHLSFPEVDDSPFLPSSLSANLIQNILIDELGFEGLIVTDALNMKGITKHFTTEEVALMTVKAGNDLILMPQGETLTIETIENAVRNGEISEERINRSVRKILTTKQWLGIVDERMVAVDGVPQLVNTPYTQELAQRIADASITLLKNDKQILPFDSRWSGKSCMMISLDNSNSILNANYMEDKMIKSHPFAKLDTLTIEGDIDDVSSIVNAAMEYDVVVIPIFARVRIFSGTVGLPDSQLKLINDLVSKGKDVVVLSMGNPYLIQGFQGVTAYVCAYGESHPAINATIKALTGEIDFNGKLPIEINEDYKIGTGLKVR